MWSTGEIITAICVGIPVLLLAARFGLLGLLLDILLAVATGGKGGGGKSSGGGFGGGSSGGGGSSSKW
jgi:uncharacterized protein